MTGVRRITAISIFFLLLLSNVDAQPKNGSIAKAHWVDSVYNKLSLDERIGQLFMVAAYSGGKNFNEEAITKLITDHQIGGLIFMQGGPVRQAALTNKYQQIAQVPLLIAMDAEWGLGMRLDSVKDLPKQMTLGASRDTALTYRMGKAIAMQCKRLGVHIDFAPVIDVNNNPDNPIINARSFGEDKTRVAKMGIAYMHGLQDNGVMACAKHFPGHGDTNADSHKDLPFINKSLDQLDSLELYPFKELIQAGIRSVMVAHLEVPALETAPHTPTTLSKSTVTGLLKEKMHFNGLVFTDALNMQGVTKYFDEGDVDVRAFIAGNDVLLFSQNVPVAIGKIKEAITNGKVTEADLEQRVKKILGAKYDAGLSHFTPINPEHITEDLNQYTDAINEQIIKSGITMVKDENGILSKLNRNIHINYVGVNAPSNTYLYDIFRDSLKLYDMPASWLPKGADDDGFKTILDKIDQSDATIVAVHNTSFYASRNYGLDVNEISFLKKIQDRPNVMVVVLGNPYILQNICDVRSAMVAYNDDSVTEKVVANVLLKKIRPHGILPVSTCVLPASLIAVAPDNVNIAKLPVGLTKTLFTKDVDVKDPAVLDKLDMFIQKCIVDQAFPGCRLVAAKNGVIFYDKSFGYYTYKKDHRVDTNTIYDVASLTKVLSTTLAVMRLYEQGKLNIDKTVGDYLPWTKGSDKAGLKIRNLLLHQAGLKSWVPFYKEALDPSTGNLNATLFSNQQSKDFPIMVTKDIYLRKDYPDTIWSEILKSPLENKGRYVYSDLDYYFLYRIVQQITGKTIDKYVEEEFYKPMGLKRITYLPLNKFHDSEIAPTEDDKAFRHELLQGNVHDQGAALFGGVAGHAGVFASADDVTAIFYMLLNKGSYRGKTYFKKTTVDYFTAYNTKISRRGLGFDKPGPDPEDGTPAGDRTTGYAFGHQGFTGTCAWADPGTGVVFVFLCNRVYPSADNNKINHLSVRTVAQDYIYEALGLPVNHQRKALFKKQIENLK